MIKQGIEQQFCWKLTYGDKLQSFSTEEDDDDDGISIIVCIKFQRLQARRHRSHEQNGSIPLRQYLFPSLSIYLYTHKHKLLTLSDFIFELPVQNCLAWHDWSPLPDLWSQSWGTLLLQLIYLGFYFSFKLFYLFIIIRHVLMFQIYFFWGVLCRFWFP